MSGQLNPVNRWFAGLLDPFRQRQDHEPPPNILGFFWHYLRQAKAPFTALLVASGMVALIDAAVFYFVGRLVDLLGAANPASGWQGLIADHGWELLAMAAVVLGGRTLFSWLLIALESITISLGFHSMVRWQAWLHVSRQSMTYFNNDFAGSIAQKVWQSGPSVGDFSINLIQTGWYIVVYTATTLVMVATLDYRLALIVAMWLALFGAIAWRSLPRIHRYTAETAEANSALHGTVVDAFANITTLKLLGTDRHNDGHIRRGFERFLEASRRGANTVTNASVTAILLSGLAIIAAAAQSIDLWSNGLMTTGAVAFTLGLLLRLNQMLMGLLNQFNVMMRNFGVAQNSATGVARSHGVVDAPAAKPLQISKGEIRFEQVHFGYHTDRPVIEGFDLTIAPGERVGVVGRSGAGKSTLMNLLLRFYDLNAGRIVIDGQDIAGVTQESLRTSIGVVTQDTSLLHRSVRENLAYGRPDATEAEVVEAARVAQAHDFIGNLTDFKKRGGYDAYVGERGIKLSGGQRQRVAIARVLLKDAPILLLDEATSALDSEVEAAIQAQFELLMRGKTVIAIAHRLSTIAAMDRLVVRVAGRIIEHGSHQQLLVAGGRYASLWSRQSGGFLTDED
jgi:ATP-binding cassette subfamily B multidrug efflux pump